MDKKRTASPLLADEQTTKRRLLSTLSDLSQLSLETENNFNGRSPESPRTVVADSDLMDTSSKDTVFIPSIDAFLKEDGGDVSSDEEESDSYFIRPEFLARQKFSNRVYKTSKKSSHKNSINLSSLNEFFINKYLRNWSLIRYYNPYQVIHDNILNWLKKGGLGHTRNREYDGRYNYWDTQDIHGGKTLESNYGSYYGATEVYDYGDQMEID